MDDQHETDLTGLRTPDAYVMSKFNLPEAISLLVREQEEPEPTGAAPELTINSLITTSWKQRVLNWFRRSMQHAD